MLTDSMLPVLQRASNMVYGRVHAPDEYGAALWLNTVWHENTSQ